MTAVWASVAGLVDGGQDAGGGAADAARVALLRGQKGDLKVPDTQADILRTPAVELAVAPHVVVSVEPLVGNEVGDRGEVLADLQPGVVRELPHAVGAPGVDRTVAGRVGAGGRRRQLDLAGDLVGLDLGAEPGVALQIPLGAGVVILALYRVILEILGNIPGGHALAAVERPVGCEGGCHKKQNRENRNKFLHLFDPP